MIKIKKNIAVVIAIMSVTACNDDFLERFPLDAISNETFWQSEGDYIAYVYGLYEGVFENVGITVWDDDQSDNQASERFNEIASGQHTVETGGWSWSFLRSCNFFLENFDRNPEISNAVKNRYKGEVLLMRSIYLANRVKTYGDIPFTNKVLTNESPELLDPRVPRTEVMAQVLSDLTFATENMAATVNEAGRLTKWAAFAFKARICLHEGTFRKYHGIAGANEFLQAAADAAKEVMDSGAHSLYSTGNPDVDYKDLFIQKDLSSNSEAIFYEIFGREKKFHRFMRFMPGSSDIPSGLTKDFVNDYLCTDGQPIGLSPLYQGDATLPEEFADRDPRLAQTIVQPGVDFWPATVDETVPSLAFAPGNTSQSTTGYHMTKQYNGQDVLDFFDHQETDLHIIRYGEVLLIYAEAMAELGQADQTVIDASINLLRARVGMPNMIIADLVRDPDSDMVTGAGYLDADVPVLLEEIRRERRVELANEGFRYDDLMRWRAGKFLTKRYLGAKWDAFKDLTTPGGVLIYSAAVEGTDYFLDADGHLDIYQNTLPSGGTFDPDKHYYFGVPLEEITLNPNLTQNPGW